MADTTVCKARGCNNGKVWTGLSEIACDNCGGTGIDPEKVEEEKKKHEWKPLFG